MNYSKQTVKQLKAECKKESIKGYSKLRKQQIITLLINDFKQKQKEFFNKGPKDLTKIVVQYLKELEQIKNGKCEYCEKDIEFVFKKDIGYDEGYNSIKCRCNRMWCLDCIDDEEKLDKDPDLWWNAKCFGKEQMCGSCVEYFENWDILHDYVQSKRKFLTQVKGVECDMRSDGFTTQEVENPDIFYEKSFDGWNSDWQDEYDEWCSNIHRVERQENYIDLIWDELQNRFPNIDVDNE